MSNKVVQALLVMQAFFVRVIVPNNRILKVYIKPRKNMYMGRTNLLFSGGCFQVGIL